MLDPSPPTSNAARGAEPPHRPSGSGGVGQSPASPLLDDAACIDFVAAPWSLPHDAPNAGNSAYSDRLLAPTRFSLGCDAWDGMGVTGMAWLGAFERVATHLAFDASGVGATPGGAYAAFEDFIQDVSDRLLLRGEKNSWRSCV